MMERNFVAALALYASACLASSAEAADHLRIRSRRPNGLLGNCPDEGARARQGRDLEIETTELASTDAGKVALEGGGADMIVSDWLWVARERGLGDKLLFTPYSSALGAVMAPKDPPIRGLADLAGRSIGVAGGPIDKSWLLLRAAALRKGLDLAKTARPSYGAPPLIAEKFAQGETDVALEFWNFCADLETRGFRRAIEMADVEKALGASGPVAMTGYVFSEAFAASHRMFSAAISPRPLRRTKSWRKTGALGSRSRRGSA